MSRRILVVDDDPSMVATLCDILSLHGWETTPGHDGCDATEIVRAGPVGLVLMDVIMPRMNGVEALGAIKASRPETHVVLMTAYAEQQLLEKAEGMGVSRILSKPVQLPSLVALLEELTQSAAVPPPAAPPHEVIR